MVCLYLKTFDQDLAKKPLCNFVQSNVTFVVNF